MLDATPSDPGCQAPSTSSLCRGADAVAQRFRPLSLTRAVAHRGTQSPRSSNRAGRTHKDTPAPGLVRCAGARQNTPGGVCATASPLIPSPLWTRRTGLARLAEEAGRQAKDPLCILTRFAQADGQPASALASHRYAFAVTSLPPRAPAPRGTRARLLFAWQRSRASTASKRSA